MVISSSKQIHWMSTLLDMSIRKDFKAVPNTTLNEKFTLDTEYSTPAGEYPTLRYYSIGVGGKPIIDDPDSFKFSKHNVTDASLFNQIPFVMKPVDKDLTKDEQSEYKFRRVETHNEIEYAVYYLKAIEDTELRDFYYQIDTVDGESVLDIFNSNTDNMLNPKPIDKTVNDVNLIKSSYIAKLIKFFFILSKKDVDNIKDVMEILKIKASHITEIGINSGYELDVKDEETNYVETKAIDVQLAYVLDTDLFIATDMLASDEITLWIEIGGSEPLML